MKTPPTAGGVSHAKLAKGHQQKVSKMKKIMNLIFRSHAKKTLEIKQFCGDPLDEPAYKRHGLTIEAIA